ncbi:CsgG/HfaB family protein [Campylobacter sp. RM9344]|uniref:CsgG/HfaB family protein n=1 Tax=Campylobacter californiensis TaxID=1032243 RepID=A0AAW3ZSG9_9BACT|nr:MULTISPECIES: CsgG/HfaB family protein [unclassified Campylobacter]MBE2985362.1 CsgG/HfaB family protein [Campylobacter sp. RM6883]MBE2987193.1 CsgG/HfaB family protein [Campylobacter sp. RM12919]MBE2988896.1 CsgG/HfaB family protein [Campylobacter sp. RM12920]MBE2995174.1 CsgG/HfaB family protein [Campylobacter sp. RM6913]MBE3029095.1 CsgG/HfaB family protein [Campylobacter sp. RM9344]
MDLKHIVKIATVAALGMLLAGCASESSRTLETPKVRAASTVYHGEKHTVSVGRFNNQSSYQNGIFSDGEDRLGNQAATILVTNLRDSGRFNVLERTNMKALEQENKFNKTQANFKGARYVVTGDVTEFGRKTTGDHQLFGILGKGKKQTAYAKVNLNVVDTSTSEVVYSSQGAGEYELSSREIIGFGGSSGYDATLNGKVLSLAIREAVDNLVTGLESGSWSIR